MCIFSGNVQSVSKTRIFARTESGGKQVLAYQMEYAADKSLAMILPLPVAAATESIDFIDLSSSEDFFSILDAHFPIPKQISRSLSFGLKSLDDTDTLEVHQVGNFVASFVPTINDFSRLDSRFALPRATWDKIPAYADYGFAVFALYPAIPKQKDELQMPRSKSPRAREPQKLETIKPHPMAFSFATRWPNATFFPTVHIHDGKVHEEEHFDHSLYTQVNTTLMAKKLTDHEWKPSGHALSNLDKRIVDNERIGYKVQLEGMLENIDTILR
jgi:hypothetical protein